METKILSTTLLVDAPKERVWQVITQQPYLNEWTSALMPESVVTGTMAHGEQIIYSDSSGMGVVAEVSEYEEGERLKISVLGEAKDGKVDLDNPESEKWDGAYDQYTLSEEDGKTHLAVESAVPAEFYNDFAAGWNTMVEKIKELSEKEG